VKEEYSQMASHANAVTILYKKKRPLQPRGRLALSETIVPLGASDADSRQSLSSACDARKSSSGQINNAI
jgi:hypothetical protein